MNVLLLKLLLSNHHKCDSNLGSGKWHFPHRKRLRKSMCLGVFFLLLLFLVHFFFFDSSHHHLLCACCCHGFVFMFYVLIFFSFFFIFIFHIKNTATRLPLILVIVFYYCHFKWINRDNLTLNQSLIHDRMFMFAWTFIWLQWKTVIIKLDDT